MDKKQLLEQFKDFAAGLSKKDRIAILHDSDADGLSAAVIAAKAVERLSGKKPVLVLTQGHSPVSIQEQTIAVLKKKKISKLITVDLAVCQNPETVRKVEKFARLLVIDHHKLYNNISSKKTVFLNAKFFASFDPSMYVTSKFCFDLFKEVVDLRGLEWVACIGILGDSALEKWEKFVKASLKSQKISMADFEMLVGLVGAVEVVDKTKMKNLFSEFFNAENPKQLLKSKFLKFSKIVEMEKKKILGGFDKKAEFFPGRQLVFFQFESKLGIKSAVINELSSRRFPNSTVIVVQEHEEGFLTISARRQDFKVRVNDLLEKAVKPLENAFAGGHIPAAGGKIQKSDLKKFKENILKELKPQKPKK